MLSIRENQLSQPNQVMEKQSMKRQPGCRQWWAVGILLASVVNAAPAFAQDKNAPSAAPKAAPTVNGPGASAAEDPEKESARLYDDGVKAAKAGQWEKARVSMLAAFKLKPSYARAANLGRVELMAAKPRDAAEHLSYFLREAQGIEADDRKAAETMLAEAKAKIATVTILANPAGAQLLVDGEPVGTAPLSRPVFVEPGGRRFEAKKEGMAQASQEVQVTAGSTPVVELKLAKEATSAATSVPVPDLPSEKPKKSKAILFGGAGLTVATLGAGIVFTVISNGKASDANTQLSKFTSDASLAPCKKIPDTIACSKLLNTNRSSDTFHNLAIAGYAAAGIVGVGTLAYALWPSKKAVPRTGLMVIPAIGGILVNGRF